jgi:hypothetical protein
VDTTSSFIAVRARGTPPDLRIDVLRQRRRARDLVAATIPAVTLNG